MTAQPAIKTKSRQPKQKTAKAKVPNKPVTKTLAEVAPELSGLIRILTCGSV